MFARYRRSLSRPLSFLTVFGCVLTATSCGSSGGGSTGPIHQMGERVQAGILNYIVLESDWVNELPGSAGPRIPEKKFLLLRVTITNSGNREVNLPMLTLVDEQGKEIMESSEGQGVEEWLGILRTIKPAETLPGRILFDAKPLNYKLRVTDGGDPGSEVTRLVSIPLRLQEYEKFEPGAGKKDLD